MYGGYTIRVWRLVCTYLTNRQPSIHPQPHLIPHTSHTPPTSNTNIGSIIQPTNILRHILTIVVVSYETNGGSMSVLTIRNGGVYTNEHTHIVRVYTPPLYNNTHTITPITSLRYVPRRYITYVRWVGSFFLFDGLEFFY